VRPRRGIPHPPRDRRHLGPAGVGAGAQSDDPLRRRPAAPHAALLVALPAPRRGLVDGPDARSDAASPAPPSLDGDGGAPAPALPRVPLWGRAKADRVGAAGTRPPPGPLLGHVRDPPRASAPAPPGRARASPARRTVVRDPLADRALRALGHDG